MDIVVVSLIILVFVSLARIITGEYSKEMHILAIIVLVIYVYLERNIYEIRYMLELTC